MSQQTLEILLRIKNEANQALKQFNEGMKETGESTKKAAEESKKWTEAQQRQAMAMSASHAEALKMNGALGSTTTALTGAQNVSKGLSDALAGKVNPALLSTQAATMAMGAAVVGLGVAIVSAIKDFAAFGSQVTDGAAKLSIGVVAFQKFTEAGKLVGVTAGDIGGAITQMKNRLNESPEAFTKLGLSVEKLKAMKPEDAFADVADAIASIQNPAEQTTAAMDAFGRGGVAVMPLIESGFRDAANAAENLGQIMSEETVAAADALDDQMTVLSSTWDGLLRNMTATIAANPELVATLGDLTSVLGSLSKGFQDNSSWISTMVGWLTKLNNAAAPVLPILKEIAKFSDDVAPTISKLAKGISFEPPGMGGKGESAQAMLDLLGEQIKETEKLGKVSADTAKKVSDAAAQQAMAYQKAAEASRVAWDKFYADMTKKGEGALRDLEADQNKRVAEMAENQRKALDQMLENQKRAAEEAIQARERELQGYLEIGDAVAMVSDLLQEMGVSGSNAFVQLLGGFSAGINAAVQFEQATTKAGKAMALLGAAQSAFSSGSAGGGAMTGALAGFAVGGPIGAGIGAIAGGLLGLFGGAKKAREEMNKLRSEFVSNMGGMAALAAKAKEAGVSLDGMFKAKSAQQLASQIDIIKGKLDTWSEAHEALNDAVSRYGFTIEELGPKFQAQRIDEMAQGLLKDWTLLVGSGIDVANVATRMADSLNELAATSKATGQALPENLRPIYEELLRQGKLVDENGNAYGSLEEAGLSFTQSLTDSMKELVVEIQRMVAAITGVRIPPIRIGIEYDDPGFPGGGGGHNAPREDPPQFAEGGHTGNGSSPFMAMLHPRETVVPDDKMPALLARAIRMAGAGSGGQRGPNNFYIGGRLVWREFSDATRRGQARVHPNANQGSW
jgi:hypothetical protein